MAKICNACGAQLSDEMVFCNKCGARYREGAPVQTAVQQTSTPAIAPKQNTKLSPMWFVSIILAIASIVLFVATPVVEISTTDASEDHSVFFFFSDSVMKAAEKVNVDGNFNVAKIVAIAAVAIGVVGVVMLIAAMFTKVSLGFVGVFAQALLLGCGALLVFALIKNPFNDIVRDVAFGFTTFGWIFLCAGSFSIVTAIKAIQSKKA